MDNVKIGQTQNTYTGILENNLDTTSENYGYYEVPLAIRNAHYPAPFPSLSSDHVKFAIIDDEMPLQLGDKMDYKDYLIVANSKGENRYAIVNPITRLALEQVTKYSGLRIKLRMVQCFPPLSSNNYRSTSSNVLIIPRSFYTNHTPLITALNEINLNAISSNNSNLSIPILIPIFKNKSGKFAYPIVQRNAGDPFPFKLVAYHNALRNGINYVAFYDI
jgi:hypothetical protein